MDVLKKIKLIREKINGLNNLNQELIETNLANKNKIIVHEENIEITETGARYLSPKANKDLSII